MENHIVSNRTNAELTKEQLEKLGILLDWLEETGRNDPIHINSMHPVGIVNMRKIIKRNGCGEV